MKDILEIFFVKHTNMKILDGGYEKRINELKKELNTKLNDEESKLLLEYGDSIFEYALVCSTENYKQGFWTGCEFMRNLNEE